MMPPLVSAMPPLAAAKAAAGLTEGSDKACGSWGINLENQRGRLAPITH